MLQQAFFVSRCRALSGSKMYAQGAGVGGPHRRQRTGSAVRDEVAMDAGASSQARRWRRPPLQSKTSPVCGSIMRLFTEKSRPAASLHALHSHSEAPPPRLGMLRAARGKAAGCSSPCTINYWRAMHAHVDGAATLRLRQHCRGVHVLHKGTYPGFDSGCT